MKSIEKGDKNIKLKVFFSYALIVVLISSLLYFTFSSFRQLTRSADVLAQPNERIALLHNIMFSIYMAESDIRSYTLNQRDSHLDDYFEKLTSINEKVDSLYILAKEDEFFRQMIDSINLQLILKTQLLEQFMQVKQMDENSAFYQQALQEVVRVTEEEKRIREVTHKSIIDTIPGDIPDYTTDEISQEKENLFTRLRNFFTGSRQDDKKPPSDPPLEKADQQIIPKVITDSIITVYRDTDELREDIEKTLTDIMNSMLSRQRQIQRLETRILTEDKIVMDQIWEYVLRLEDYERGNALTEAAAAHSTVRNTTDKIFLLVVLSLIVLLVFSWLFVSDVNRSRYYRRQLLEEKARAEQLVEIKQRFMANISHEIRTPLNSIIGFSKQLRKKLSNNKKEEEFIDAINQSSAHLLGIVNDILDFSKIEAGKIRLEKIPVNLEKIIHEVYDTLVILAREKNLEFEKDLDELKQPMVLSDPLRLRQIVLNIASNAIKFTHSGSVTIKVSDYMTREDSRINHVRIRITDTGIGISPEDQERIFEEFAQSDSKVNRQHGGTGLGLSISRKLTEYMGGNIELVSQPGKGSVFSIHLPLEICADEVSVTDLSHTTTHEEFKGKILLVDDDRLNRLLISSLMEMAPQLALHEAESASEALELLSGEQYDLVITDIQMPGLSGIELVKILRNQKENPNHTTPVLACTADVTPETVQGVLDAGMEDYIPKPIDEKILIEKINILMNKGNNVGPELAEQSENEDGSSHEEYLTETGESRSSGQGLSKPFETNDSGVMYDLEGLKSFTGNDDASTANILRTFIEETRQNIGKLERAGVSKDTEEVRGVIHKMSNMLGLLNAREASLCIRKLNGNGKLDLNDPETIEKLQNLIRLSNELLEALKEDSLLKDSFSL